MPVKGQAESQERGRAGRRRELLGILLLAFAVFASLSLVSLHAGDNKMMGPGGATTAAGLYALFGIAAYLVTAAMLVGSWRAFRGARLVGFAEGSAGLGLLSAVTVLLHLPFAGRPSSSHGPGGLFGQWLGEVAASFIGSIGAGLAASALLFMTLLFLTNIQLREVMVVLAWVARNLGAGSAAAFRATARMVVAMFPRRDESEARRGEAGTGDRDGDDDDDDDGGVREIRAGRLAPAIAGRVARSSAHGAGHLDAADDDQDQDQDQDDRDELDLDELERARQRRRLGAIPEPMAAEDSDAVRVGEIDIADVSAPRGPSGERAAMAAIVAELAAVERLPEPAPPATARDDGELRGRPLGATEVAAVLDAAPHVIEELPDGDAPTPAPGAADGPIIVEPAWRTRLRERERAEAEAEAAGAAADDEAAAAVEPRGPGFIRLKDGAYALPGTDLLEYLPPQGNEMDKQALYDMADRLEQAMANYGVRGKVKEIHMGPVVTMYEFAPAPGTRTGKIANLEKDLAMALEAQAVRIVAPIPGKAVVGVEVPNRTREMVYLREILEDDCFTKASSKLQMALGKDIKGAPVSVNLAKMPHLLVAGTTGSGKSVAVNGMIVSLLYNASPEDVRFIMVDPKMLELSIYEGIPHLLLPVVTDPKKANLALRWAVEEMERRYELLAKAGVRDIAGYNAKLEAAKPGAPSTGTVPGAPVAGKKRLKVMITGPDGVEQEVELDPADEAPAAAPAPAIPSASTPTADAAPAAASSDGTVQEEMDPEEVSGQAAAAQAGRAAREAEPQATKLPYIVIVIDEFADLMMVAPKDVETSVARIAQKARAAGLHLILATQRPSVDVITGLIKANFPSRIALQVASKIDSRTILDQPGADTLLGNGDMLFSDRGLKLRRVHGAFLGDEEVHRVVDHLKGQAKPVYDMDILKPRDEDSEEGGAPADDFHDDLYDQAVAIVCETRQASVSYIQRRLQIGYNRSARMVEQMERDGVVGPANGAKPREVLAPPGEYLQQAG